MNDPTPGTVASASGDAAPTEATRAESETAEAAVTLRNVSVAFRAHRVVGDVNLDLAPHKVTALVGPSGCGKTTLLRTINRLHDDTGGKVTGQVHVGDLDIYARDTRPEFVRSLVGMVFQRPNPFPTMSIFDNVVAGLRLNGVRSKAVLREAAEAALHHAALWDLVKDRLHAPAVRLSGGQQQRLCIARALAVEPEVLLMDEPCSALDPIATAKIEELITRLSVDVTIGLVTHNMFQATRVLGFHCRLHARRRSQHRRAGRVRHYGADLRLAERPSHPGIRLRTDGVTSHMRGN